jgi:hypothetical protein
MDPVGATLALWAMSHAPMGRENQGHLVLFHLDGIKMECGQMGKDGSQEAGEAHRKTPLDNDRKMELLYSRCSITPPTRVHHRKCARSQQDKQQHISVHDGKLVMSQNPEIFDIRGYE